MTVEFNLVNQAQVHKTAEQLAKVIVVLRRTWDILRARFWL